MHLGNSKEAKNETRLCMFRYMGGIIHQMEGLVEDIVKSTEGQVDADQAGPGGNTAQMLCRGGDVALISAFLPTGGVFLNEADSCLFMSTEYH